MKRTEGGVVLTRKRDESICFDDLITLKVLSIERAHRVVLHCSAPKSVQITRPDALHNRPKEAVTARESLLERVKYARRAVRDARSAAAAARDAGQLRDDLSAAELEKIDQMFELLEGLIT